MCQVDYYVGSYRLAQGTCVACGLVSFVLHFCAPFHPTKHETTVTHISAVPSGSIQQVFIYCIASGSLHKFL